MEKAKVYFSDLRTSPTSNLLDKMERLLKRAGIGQLPLKKTVLPLSRYISANRAIWHISVLIMPPAWQICSAVSEPNLF